MGSPTTYAFGEQNWKEGKEGKAAGGGRGHWRLITIKTFKVPVTDLLHFNLPLSNLIKSDFPLFPNNLFVICKFNNIFNIFYTTQVSSFLSICSKHLGEKDFPIFDNTTPLTNFSLTRGLLNMIPVYNEGVLYSSYPWDLVSRASSNLFSLLSMCMMPGVSNFWRIQLHCSSELMNMNSTPWVLRK